MKTVSILITNYNSEEAIHLCIESIRKYTRYSHKIIIYDDNSTNKIDLEYLRKTHYKDWIQLLEGKTRINHGRALNELLDYCNADLAVILDNDIQILEKGWLEKMVELMEDERIIMAAGIEDIIKEGTYRYWFQSWFMALNIKAYRDGFESDWGLGRDEGGLVMPMGARLYRKIMNENPKGYKVVPIPEPVKRRFYHHVHISMLSGHPGKNEQRVRANRLDTIKKELEKLRARN